MKKINYLSDNSRVSIAMRELAYAYHTQDRKLLLAVTCKYKKLLGDVFRVRDSPAYLEHLFRTIENEKALPPILDLSDGTGRFVRIGIFYEDNLKDYVALGEDLSPVDPLEPASYLFMSLRDLPLSVIKAQFPLKCLGKHDIPLVVKVRERSLRERAEMAIKRMPRKHKPLTFP